jgi:hypothetical protein
MITRAARSRAARAAGLLAITAGLVTVGATVAIQSASADSVGCSQYYVAGTWNVSQDNIPNAEFTFNLTQSGQTVGGTASYTDNSVITTGDVAGTVQGNAFDVVITWSAQSAGHYTATVTPSAMTNGTTYDVHNPSSTANWSATGTDPCEQAPTSKDQCKNAGWASGTLVDASGNPFKNQGDCVSFVASGGKSDPQSS